MLVVSHLCVVHEIMLTVELCLSPLQELSKLSQLPHQQKGLQMVYEHHELQSSTLDYSLAAAVASLRVSCQDSSITELQKQCTSTLDLLEKQWTLMKGVWIEQY